MSYAGLYKIDQIDSGYFSVSILHREPICRTLPLWAYKKKVSAALLLRNMESASFDTFALGRADCSCSFTHLPNYMTPTCTLAEIRTGWIKNDELRTFSSLTLVKTCTSTLY